MFLLWPTEDLIGPPFLCGLLLLGGWIGWRATTGREGENAIPTQGFFRGSTNSLRVWSAGLGLAFIGFLLRLSSKPIGSTALAWVTTGIAVLAMGVSFGAGIRSWIPEQP